MVENPIHASIVLNIHREAVFLRRTLLSLSEAGAFARSKGIYLELIAVLDRTDDETRQVLSSSDLSIYEKIKIIEVDNGSLGPSRNDGINQSSGEYIFTADADDLVSYNYFHDILPNKFFASGVSTRLSPIRAWRSFLPRLSSTGSLTYPAYVPIGTYF